MHCTDHTHSEAMNSIILYALECMCSGQDCISMTDTIGTQLSVLYREGSLILR